MNHDINWCTNLDDLDVWFDFQREDFNPFFPVVQAAPCHLWYQVRLQWCLHSVSNNVSASDKTAIVQCLSMQQLLYLEKSAGCESSSSANRNNGRHSNARNRISASWNDKADLLSTSESHSVKTDLIWAIFKWKKATHVASLILISNDCLVKSIPKFLTLQWTTESSREEKMRHTDCSAAMVQPAGFLPFLR